MCVGGYLHGFTTNMDQVIGNSSIIKALYWAGTKEFDMREFGIR